MAFQKKEISVAHLMGELRALMAKDIVPRRRIISFLSLLCEELNMPTAILYLMRPGDVLEKVFFVGKNIKLPDFIRMGEGHIGLAALQRKALFIENATGFKAEIFVPLIRGSQVVGVLSLISRKAQHFENEVKEAIENVAMVLAEFLMVISTEQKDKTLPDLRQSQVFEGNGLIAGFAVGEVLQHQRMEQNAPIFATSSKKEKQRLDRAFARVQKMIKRRLDKGSRPSEEKEIFETYWLFLNDADWWHRVVLAIDTGLTAEAALQKVVDETVEKMRLIVDPYLRERTRDFQDLAASLMRALAPKKQQNKLVGSKILVADSLGAAELLDYDLKHIKGIVLEDTSQTSHVVIVARACSIPLIGGVKDAKRQLDEGVQLALDATCGKVYVRPSDEVLDALKLRKSARHRWQQVYARNLDRPAVTKDGVDISLMLNLGVNLMGSQGKLPPSDGVGLYRTELLFMTSKSLPDIRTQTEAYRRVLMLAKKKKVVFRTLDIGSDKVLPYFNAQAEENPAMGWRSIRMTLDRRSLLRSQLRALIRATAGQELYVMFPMITEVSEFVEAKKTLMMELKSAQNRREKIPLKVFVGTMLEVPSLIFQLDVLLPLVDFVSIGTNDFGQFMFAADRTNGIVSRRYDVLSPAFLKAIYMVVQACSKYKVPCSVCGEMAATPLEAIVLLGLGVRILSMNVDSLGAVKTAVRSLNLSAFSNYLKTKLTTVRPSLRETISSYLRDHNVQMEISS